MVNVTEVALKAYTDEHAHLDKDVFVAGFSEGCEERWEKDTDGSYEGDPVKMFNELRACGFFTPTDLDAFVTGYECGFNNE